MRLHPGASLLIALGAAALLEQCAPASLEVPFLLRFIPSTCAFTVGGSLLIWAVKTMRRENAEIEPNREPSAFVSTGPYRFSRNPMYIANLLFIAAFVTLTWSAWFVLAGVVQAALLGVWVIPQEELRLKRAFPVLAAEWFSRTRRWI